ncbi:hypothetical protein AB4090_05630 [Acidithiobacillus sp. IBUN Pt1247-S3]|uniref:hypothetical protein n=1 Tax=Acidithiobacillus sp. IBUN Pt1247-S3 TaxID=3166642 RepID=UPI0034E3E1F5
MSISQEDIRLVDADLMRHDAKSLALFRAIYAKLMAVPDRDAVLRAAQAWARRFSQERPNDAALSEWIGILERALASDAGMDAMVERMLAKDDHAITLRSSSPFAGVLTVKERTAVLLRFEQEWRDDRRTA